MTARPIEGAGIAVCVSGHGTNLRALVRASRRGLLAGPVVLVLADRPCPAIEWAQREGIPTALVARASFADPGDWDRAVAAALEGARARVVALAGFIRIVGPATLDAFRDRILNVHPSLLPSFPGAHAIHDALAAGVRVTGVTVHVVDEVLDGGPVVLQEPVVIVGGDTEETLLERIHRVEHRLFPRAVRLLASGAATVGEDRRVTIDPTRAAALPHARRALVSVSDKAGLEELARGLDALGFELVSTGGTARAIRSTGLDVTDVSAVTGVPEMLAGRVKTLHPRIAAGVLADLRRPEHAAQLASAGIDPFELVVVNLYAFAAAVARPGIDVDQLIEEIDVGGPTLVRAAAKNHASVGIVTDPATYPAILEELRRDGALSEDTRRALAVAAFRHTAAYDALIAAELPGRLGLAAAERFPDRLALPLERVQALRYGENPHQDAALYRVPGTPPSAGPLAAGVDVRQGKPLSYTNLLDVSAAAALARDLRGPACVIVKHTNPCGAAEADDLATAWERALAADPVSAFGGVVAVTRPIDAALAHALTSLFLEVVVAPRVEPEAAAILTTRPNLRVVVDGGFGGERAAPIVEYRSAGGGMLATESDVLPDDPATWRLVTSREPDEREVRDLDLAWRIARHVTSNAIVLVRDGALVGTGAGQMSRVDSAHLAVWKAGPARARGAACASDAYYPFPDGLLVCAEAGVTAFAEPGGSVRDDEVITAAEAAGVSLLLTGVRHFRH